MGLVTFKDLFAGFGDGLAEEETAAIFFEKSGAQGVFEFVVVLAEVYDSAAVSAVAEQIREAVCEPMSIGQDHVKLTISIGVAFAESETSPDRLLANADAALYEAKNSGRDRIATFTDG